MVLNECADKLTKAAASAPSALAAASAADVAAGALKAICQVHLHAEIASVFKRHL